MKKEVGYAIIAGILLGLVVAYGVYRINSQISKSNKQSAASVTSPTPTPQTSTTKEFKIVLDKPEENDVISEPVVEVSGITKPNYWIAVTGEGKDYALKSDSSGGFKEKVDLTSGINQIKVTAFDTNGNQSISEVLVIYSSAFNQSDASASAKTATGSSDLAKETQKNVNNVLNKPKAYIGTVTDVTGTTIELKSNKGDIKQIAMNIDTTTVVNITGTNNKTVKTSDIAIGDFIAAMGSIGQNSVLNAQRVLITDALGENKNTVNIGKISTVSRKSVDVGGLTDGKTQTLTPDTKTEVKTIKDGILSVFKFASLKTDDTVIYTISPDPKTDTRVRTIIALPLE